MVVSIHNVYCMFRTLAHTMQCTGLSGVLRIVQIGYTFCAALGKHS